MRYIPSIITLIVMLVVTAMFMISAERDTWTWEGVDKFTHPYSTRTKIWMIVWFLTIILGLFVAGLTTS